MSTRTYEATSGLFVQDDPTATPSVIGPTPDFFGLVSRSWPAFIAEIDGLLSKRSESVSYKVLFLGRHGEGYHNVAITKYGKKAWDEKWSLIDGDGELTWGPDPRLTPIGEEQAHSAHAAWERELRNGAPVPQRFYCSPLTRAIHTLELTFENILPTHMKPFILENCREMVGEHTCDKRKTRSEIEAEFPNVVFEDGFEEDDVLWTPERESDESVEKRAKLILDRIFQYDHENTYISVTAHSGWIDGVLRAMGWKDYDLPTGGIIVVVVKGTVV